MSNKYVLDPSGKIIINGNLEDANEASEKILKNQNDFFQQRRQSTADKAFSPARAQLDLGALKGIDNAFNSVELTQFDTLLTSETPDFPNPRDDQEGHVIFPRKKNNQLLVNSSFGADSDTNINYYTPYNSIFSRDGSNRRIYAEELEMLTGLDLNSLGLSASGLTRDRLNSDFTQIVFIFDFLIESLAYVGTFWAINLINKAKVTKNNDTPIQYYFSKILNTGNYVETTDLLSLLNYYVVGLDRFINTDPKSKSLRDLSNFDDPNRIKFFDIFRVAIRNILSISKVGRNRMFLLIRKFQQESYWHTELLYKHKQDTSENGIDKFFIEFSNYYFKFIIERINIGYIVLNKNVLDNSKALNNIHGFLNKYDVFYDQQKSRNWENGNLVFDVLRYSENESYVNNDLPGKPTLQRYGLGWLWSSENNSVGKSKVSISTLPQLFLSADRNNRLNDNFIYRSKTSKLRRLPQKLVKKVEEYLDNEYMPFYLHDLRTNEIVSMHAFLDSISDSFSPEYSSNSGYGRIDDVKHYVKTTRNINITFSLVSMQEEDHDLMWYQINKIVSMVYPQWSAGIPATTGKFKNINGFTYPFTQVPTASPLIRLRVGDVLKSNYTKKNIERLHFKSTPFKEEKSESLIDKELRLLNKDVICYGIAPLDDPSDFRYIDSVTLGKNITEESKNTLKHTEIKYFSYDLNKKSFFKHINFLGKKSNLNDFKIIDKKEELNYLKINSKNKSRQYINKIDESWIFFTFDDREININSDPKDAKGSDFIYYCAFDPKTNIKRTYKKSPKISDEDRNLSDAEIGGVINNPYTKAFETAGGKGLAGFITSLDVNYQDVTWETNNPGSNAPHSVKITMGFSPIHDIAPGLDHEGIMRAPIYNVGNLNKSFFGDNE